LKTLGHAGVAFCSAIDRVVAGMEGKAHRCLALRKAEIAVTK
jgi:hypothetical protein